MSTFIIYIIRWAVVLTLLYSLYGLFMKRETLHALNRVVLLVILAASMILPLVQVNTREANIMTQGREMIEQQIMNIQAPFFSDADYSPQRPTPALQHPAPTSQHPTSDTQHVNIWIVGLILTYLAGLLVSWLRYFWQIAALVRLIHKSKRVIIAGVPSYVRVVTHPDVKSPCSWMRWILFNPSDAELFMLPSSSGGVSGGLVHELSHVRLRHSWDMLFCEFTCRMLWCVPFAWMLRQDLRDVHEFQADRHVLQSGIDENEYQLLLIRKATGTGLQPVVNALNQSPIKRRFIMMYKKPSRRWVALKAAYLVPLGALALVAFARPQAMGEIEKQVEEAAPVIAEAVKVVTSTGEAIAETETTAAQQLAESRPDGVEPTLESETAEASLTAEAPTTDLDPTKAWRRYEGLSDSNLVKADLAEQSETELKAKGMAVYRNVNELTDSVMKAVGARKIAEGTYVGHFQPNLNSDTLRIRQVDVLDRQSRVVMASGIRSINADDPYAYYLTLQLETRKDRTGYYIRYLQPANSKNLHYDRKHVDPYMLSTDSVLTKRSSRNFFSNKPAAIERSKNETRIYMYVGFGAHPQVDELKRTNYNLHHELAIVDERTDDKYVCRATDYDYFKYVKDEYIGSDTIKVYQTCLVFPPIDKRVDAAHFGRWKEEGRLSNTFYLNAIPRKGRVIIH